MMLSFEVRGSFTPRYSEYVGGGAQEVDTLRSNSLVRMNSSETSEETGTKTYEFGINLEP